jgi:hypothetical protein
VSAPKCSVSSLAEVSGKSGGRNGGVEALGILVVAALGLRRGRIQTRRP